MNEYSLICRILADMKRILPFFILSLMLVLFAEAQERKFDESTMGEKGRASYQALLKIDIFALGGVDYAGITSKGEEALDTLLEEKEAIPALKTLVTQATPEGGV